MDSQLEKGALHELEEHGDVIGNDINSARKIASAHLRERPDYYEMLDTAETKPSGFYFSKTILIFNYMWVIAVILAIILCIYVLHSYGYLNRPIESVKTYVCS